MVTCSIFFRTICVALVTLLISSYSGAQPITKSVDLVSPEISENRQITFRLYAPDANEVTITGEWINEYNRASEKLIRSPDGIWSITTSSLKEDLYVYYYNVDGVRALDPGNPYIVRSSGNLYANYVVVSGRQSNLYGYNNVPHGTLSKIWYESPIMGMKRRVFVYTPPGYETGRKNYPVLYLLHGGLQDEEAWSNCGRVVQILDNLIASGAAEPMIVVMPNGNGNQMASPNDIKPLDAVQNEASVFADAALFSQSMVKDIVPFIERNFRVVKNKDHRAIAGLSLGAINTQTIVNDSPGMFSYIGVFSFGIRNLGKSPEEIDRETIIREQKIEILKQAGYKLYWIGCGKEDFVYSSVVELKKVLDKHNLSYVYQESAGGHTFSNWRLYLSEFIPLIFK